MAEARTAPAGTPLRFDDAFLKKLEYLHVVSNRAFAGHNRADRLTPTRGRGLEFADHRPYAAGRRLPAHRLEGLQAPEPPAAAAVRRGAGSADLPDAGRQPIDGRTDEVRPGTAARGGALLHRPGTSRQGHDPAVRRRARARDASGPRQGAHLPRLRGARAPDAGRPYRSGRLLPGLRVALPPDRARGRHLRLPRPARTRARSQDSADDRPRRVRRTRHLRTGSRPGAPRRRQPRGRRERRGAERGDHARAARAYKQAWQAHADRLAAFCGRYAIGYVRADAERPFEEVVLTAFRQGRFLA
jgi:hypothetical protein